jgi:hypothetical protein
MGKKGLEILSFYISLMTGERGRFALETGLETWTWDLGLRRELGTGLVTRTGQVILYLDRSLWQVMRSSMPTMQLTILWFMTEY